MDVVSRGNSLKVFAPIFVGLPGLMSISLPSMSMISQPGGMEYFPTPIRYLPGLKFARNLPSASVLFEAICRQATLKKLARQPTSLPHAFPARQIRLLIFCICLRLRRSPPISVRCDGCITRRSNECSRTIRHRFSEFPAALPPSVPKQACLRHSLPR